MLKKIFEFDGFKEISDKGEFRGLLSPYFPYVDSVGDSVMQGAYKNSITQKGLTRVLLWQHDQAKSIGEVTLEDRTDGLYVKGQLLMSLGDAQEAWKRIKAGLARGLSIGFLPTREKIENGIRKLFDIALFEASIVTFPAAEAAVIQSIKSTEEIDTQYQHEFKSYTDRIEFELKNWR